MSRRWIAPLEVDADALRAILPAMATCPVCKRTVEEVTRDGLRVLPYHDLVPPARALCPASRMTMAEAGDLAKARDERSDDGR